MSTHHYDVVIIGGGVAGCAIARELSRYQLRVALLERYCDVGFGTSKANSGIIHGGHHAKQGTLKGRLEWAGNQLWDALHDELDFGFRRVGELTVALTEDQVPILKALRDNGSAKGIKGLEIWERERILRTEPNLSPSIVAALYAPATGVVNPYEACFRFAECAQTNGLDLWLDCAVTELKQDETMWDVATSTGHLRTRYVINAAGLYSDKIADLAGVRDFTIHPRKGEEYLLDKRLSGLVKRVIFPCPTPVSKGILVIPTYDGTLMVGPTAQTSETKDDFTTSPQGAAEVFAFVKSLVPGINERDVIAQFGGLRAAAVSDDGSHTDDFIIGPTSKRGFINVAGIQSPGLTAAPAIALMVVDMLRGEGLRLGLKDHFVATLPQPVRFMLLSTEAQMVLANVNPRYRRMVCRCEFVTEGEVVDAIHRGAGTLDGIKFRTRAGMGRCQGGFCSARCMELLARERGIPWTALTKRGGKSWLVLDRAEVAPEGDAT